MSAVDVLAVLDVYCQRAGNEPTADVVKARAAVAEMIEAAALVVEYDPTFLELQDALARCRGGAA